MDDIVSDVEALFLGAHIYENNQLQYPRSRWLKCKIHSVSSESMPRYSIEYLEDGFIEHNVPLWRLRASQFKIHLRNLSDNHSLEQFLTDFSLFSDIGENSKLSSTNVNSFFYHPFIKLDGSDKSSLIGVRKVPSNEGEDSFDAVSSVAETMKIIRNYLEDGNCQDYSCQFKLLYEPIVLTDYDVDIQDAVAGALQSLEESDLSCQFLAKQLFEQAYQLPTTFTTTERMIENLIKGEVLKAVENLRRAQVVHELSISRAQVLTCAVCFEPCNDSAPACLTCCSHRHVMHGACFANLNLGGMPCPTCRGGFVARWTSHNDPHVLQEDADWVNLEVQNSVLSHTLENIQYRRDRIHDHQQLVDELKQVKRVSIDCSVVNEKLKTVLSQDREEEEESDVCMNTSVDRRRRERTIKRMKLKKIRRQHMFLHQLDRRTREEELTATLVTLFANVGEEVQNSNKLSSKADIVRGIRYLNIAQERCFEKKEFLLPLFNALTNGGVDSAARMLRDVSPVTERMKDMELSPPRRRRRRTKVDHAKVLQCVCCGDSLGAVLACHDELATCVQGHCFHASCFAARVALLEPCPCCDEPLVTPKVKLVKEADDDDCCCGGGVANITNEDVDEAAIIRELDLTQKTCDVKLLDCRQCSGCGAGPILQTNCTNLLTHHGQCPQCSFKVQNLSEQVQKKIKQGGMSVYDAIPTCTSCKTNPRKVIFNGCYKCGMQFHNWNSLPMANIFSEGTWTKNAEDAAILEAIRKAKQRLLFERNIQVLNKDLISASLELSHDLRMLSPYVRHHF